jgi:hypothetical protein
MEMLNGSLSHGGGRRIPGADLGDRNIPALKAATVEDGAPATCSDPLSRWRRTARVSTCKAVSMIAVWEEGAGMDKGAG